jgi:hypothetical protein
VKNSVFPTNPGTAGVPFGVQPVPMFTGPLLTVPWHPVAQRDDTRTQVALRVRLPAREPVAGNPKHPSQLIRPVSTTVNKTTNRPCIWSYRTLALSITQLAFDRGRVGHSSVMIPSPIHTSRKFLDVGGK